MNPAFFLTALGPILGGIGLLIDMNILVFVGAAICCLIIFLNVASGVMKLPVLPLAAVVCGGAIASSWLYGAALGLLAWTAIESAGELVGAFGK